MKQLEPILFIVLIFAVFYFLLIRPQRKRQRETQQMQQNLRPGSEVVTTAGMYARVVAFEGDDSVLLEVAPGVTCRYLKQAIMRVVPDATAQAAAAPTPVVDATPEPAEEPAADEAAATTEAQNDAKPEAEAATTEAENEPKPEEPAADGAAGAAATTEPAEATGTDGTATDGTSPEGKADAEPAKAEAAKAEESGTAKGEQRSPS